MTNARHKNQVSGIVKFVSRQIAATPARNDELSQPALNRPTDTGLMRQNLQCIKYEIQNQPRRVGTRFLGLP